MDKKIVTLAGAIYIAWLMVSAGSDFIAHFEMLEKTRGG